MTNLIVIGGPAGATAALRAREPGTITIVPAWRSLIGTDRRTLIGKWEVRAA